MYNLFLFMFWLDCLWLKKIVINKILMILEFKKGLYNIFIYK